MKKAGAMKSLNPVTEVEQEEHEADTPGARGSEEKDEKREDSEGEDRKRGGAMKKRARGGRLDGAKEHKVNLEHHHARKRGGHVPGKETKSRPDRRARGGATSDMNPTTAAGNMKMPSFLKKDPITSGGGMGGDMSPYKGGSHRRPG